ncbi:MAG: hypothetical protein J6C06_02895 [Lachnospiraceae bacterium]|nr:hypothetical protein [Lachnospiraceae bacterium]
MYEILNFFKILFDFALDFMKIPIDIYGVDFTLWEVFLFVFLGSVLFGVIVTFFTGNKE